MTNNNHITTLISRVLLHYISQELQKQQPHKKNQHENLGEINTVSSGFTSISKWVPLRVLTKIFIFVGRVSAYRNLRIARHLSDCGSRRRLLQIEKAEGKIQKTKTQVTMKQKSSLCPLYIWAGGWRQWLSDSDIVHISWKPNEKSPRHLSARRSLRCQLLLPVFWMMLLS